MGKNRQQTYNQSQANSDVNQEQQLDPNTGAEGAEDLGGQSDQTGGDTAATDTSNTITEQSVAEVRDSGKSGTVTDTAPTTVAAPVTSGPQLSSAGQLFMNQIAGYMENMDPKMHMDPKTGQRHQKLLYTVITNIINRLEGTDFQATWTQLLRLFRENKDGVFAERHVFRFFEYVDLDREQRAAFQRLLVLLVHTADIKSRELVLKQTDMSKVLQYGVTEEGRQRVLGYYNQ